MEFRILGPLEVTRDGQPLVVNSARQRALLALLITNVNRPLSPDRIIDELWGEEPPDSGTKAVVFHISKLRETLEPGRAKGESGSILVTEALGYTLKADPESIDSVRFERLATEGRAILRDDADSAATTLREALSLWRGAPLSDFTYEPFAQSEIRRLAELRLRVVEDRLEADLTVGHHDAVVGELEGLVDEHPLRERLRGQLMLALYRCGRQAESLRTYQEGRRLLAEELGIDPSPELRRLEDLILRQDAELDPTSASPAAPRNPYKGLRPFGEADTPDFFGRERLIDRLVDRLSAVSEAGRILTLVGPSGSGKSSVVRAGLIPALRGGALYGSERWLITVMYPGSRPWEELEAALLRAVGQTPQNLRDQLEQDAHGLARVVMQILPSDDSCLLLVIDQLEELFSLVTADDIRDRFVHSLLEATSAEHSRLLVVATLRADFFDRLLRQPDLGEQIQGGVEVITPLTSSELEKAISNPAEAVGVGFEPGLAAEIVSDVADQPGALPLLQYALTELFDQREGPTIGSDAYEAVGGVLDALGQRAEQTYLGLIPEVRDTARQLFLGLVTSGVGAQAVASRMTQKGMELLLGPGAPPREVLNEFGRRRLLTFDRDAMGEPTVEVAHEALLSRWPRLAGWIDEQREDLWVRSRLHTAADEWVGAERNVGFLLAAGRLDLFQSWVSSTNLPLSPVDKEFLEASLEERRRQEAADAARAAHETDLEHRAANRLRAMVAVFATAAMVAVALSLVVFGQQQAARQQEAIAAAREMAAASIGTLGADPQLSLLLGLEAAAITADRGYVVEEAMDALHWAVQEARIPYPATEAPVAIRSALDGYRGVILLPPRRLVELAAGSAGRDLTGAECRIYLHQEACPDARDWSGGRLDVYTDDGPAPVEQWATNSLEGARVRVIAELEGDPAPLATEFSENSGIEVEWVLDVDEPDLAALNGEGERPDVVVTSRIGSIASLAEQGHLVDMNVFLDSGSIGAGVDDYLVGLTTGDEGRLYGVPWAVSVSSLVWYPVREFEAAGYQIPQTWNELIALSDRIVSDGRMPWCLGVDAGDVPGAIATDWVEDLVLQTAGPKVYDRWVAHKTSFRDPAIQGAYERFGEVAFGEGFVLGGSVSIIHIERELAAWPMFSDPPRCWLNRDGSESPEHWPKSRSVEMAAFPLPAVDPELSQAMTGRVYMIAMLTDRPEVRRFVEYMLTPQVATAVAATPLVQGLLPAQTVDSSLFSDDARRMHNDLLRTALDAGVFRADASDLMPPQIGLGSFPEGLVTYLTWGAPSLRQVLIESENAWP
jgi:DNA-binding SARP family transcriptional activator/ABC-type glycerol-3-phosphate transport system substrate-binding protein